MSVILRWEALIVELPNPQFGDIEQSTDQLTIERSMTGRIFSFIKKSDRKRVKYTFSLSRQQVFSLQNFYTIAHSQIVTLINWHSETWKGYILNNPLEFVEEHNYNNTIDLEFEGLRIS